MNIVYHQTFVLIGSTLNMARRLKKTRLIKLVVTVSHKYFENV